MLQQPIAKLLLFGDKYFLIRVAAYYGHLQA